MRRAWRQALVGLMTAGLLVGPAAVATATTTAPSCTWSSLHVHHQQGGAALGHSDEVLLLVNVSSRPCSLMGYLDVDVLKTHDKTLIRAKDTTAGYIGGLAQGVAIPSVVLKPGGWASALVEGLGVGPDDRGCPLGWGLALRLPAGGSLVRLRFPVGYSCSAETHPVVAGRTGDLS